MFESGRLRTGFCTNNNQDTSRQQRCERDFRLCQLLISGEQEEQRVCELIFMSDYCFVANSHVFSDLHLGRVSYLSHEQRWGLYGSWLVLDNLQKLQGKGNIATTKVRIVQLLVVFSRTVTLVDQSVQK